MLKSLCLLLALLGAALPARAQDAIGAALGLLASTKFEEVERGIELLARSGGERALPILEALGQGRLLARASDRTVYVETETGALVAGATGELVELPRNALKPVRVNNRIRRALEAATGSLTLMSPDPARRLEAARAVWRARDPRALAPREQALAREEDAGVRAVMEQGRAAILLADPDTAEPARLAAIATLAARGDREALALLQGVATGAAPAIADAAAKAIATIERRLQVLTVAQNVVYGISLGSVLLLAAIGLAITFGVMGVINMAHGELVMLGAYTTYLIQEWCRTQAPEALPFALLAAIPLAFLVTGGVGVAIERAIIRFLYGRPLETLLATFGLSLILQQAVRSLFGPSNREVSTPAWMSGSLELLPGLAITANRLAITLFCLLAFACLLCLIRFSRFGLEMRSVVQNRRMAASMGIRTGRVDALTFGLGSGVAGIAGVALSQIDNVSPNLGQGYIIDSFLVVVFGGVGNLWGTFTGAFTLGIANKLLEPAAGAVLGKILLLVGIILFIQKRPRGLFALRGRAVEA